MIMPEDIEQEVRRIKLRKKMLKKGNKIPMCHGEPMQVTEHRKVDKVMLMTYSCMYHNCSTTDNIMEEKEEDIG